MQFHLDGFRPGDPTLAPAADRRADPSCVDVLIVGSGPAGLTLAAYLSQFPEIATRIVEQRDGPMQRGQADGVSCRSMEMFEAFGFAHKVRQEAYWVNEVAFWKPDPDAPGHITRTGRVQDVEDGLSEQPHVILNQARVHDMYLEVMAKSPSRLVPDYNLRFTGLTVEAQGDYPVQAVLTDTRTGATQTVRARHVVGCDGARSGVRRAIGRELRGEAANKAWGVMDVLAVTDFPDIRQKTLIQSEAGSIIIIPREGGYLARIYVEMDSLGKDERVRDRGLTVDHLIGAAQRIFRPYSLDVKEVAWWSVYEIGQRLTDRFDDAPADGSGAPRVFIAGDACHTHSPKAGQGMNVSMGDGFNLGWKLVHVLRGQADPALLSSYSAERQAVAQDLIDFDEEWARILAERDSGTGDAPRFQKYFVEHGRYTAGVAVQYRPSALTGTGRWQGLAEGFGIGTRFHSAPVVRQADGRPMHLGHVIGARARWHLFAFAGAGDVGAAGGGLARLCAHLADDPASALRRVTPEGADVDAVIDLRAILQPPFREVEAGSLPPLLRPRKGWHGLIDYEKVFCAAHKDAPDIFEARGIDRARGALVVVRPDQYVAEVLPLDAFDALSAFFDGVLLPAAQTARGALAQV